MLRTVLKKLKGSVRTKVLLVVFASLLLPMVLIFVEGRLLINAIAPLEQEILTKDRSRFERAIELEFSEILKDNLGWAVWTEFYDYFSAPNDPKWVTFRKDNIDDQVPALHNMQLIVNVTPQGEIVYEYGSTPEFSRGHNIADTPLFQETVAKHQVTGFLHTSDGYYAIASATVHRSEDHDKTGPWSGIYIIGRRVDEAYLSTSFSARLLVPVALVTDGLDVGNEGLVKRDKNVMTISFPLDHVLYGASVPTVRMTESRDLFQIAYAKLFQIGLALISVAILALILTFIVFEGVVFRPLFRFLRQVEESGRSGKLANVIVAKTGDEFEHLTKTYNSMVEAVGRAEEQMLVSQKFLQMVLETVPLPIVVIDKDSDRVTMVNSAGRRMLVDVVGGTSWTDFLAFLKMVRTLDNSVYPLAKNPYVLVKGKDRPAQVDDIMLKVENKSLFFSMIAQPLQLSQGDRPQVLVALFDISKQREVERLRTEFADIVAHQLRTPLTALKWAVDATEGANPKEQETYLAEISSTVDRTLALINQLLSIARLAAGRMKFALQPTVLKDVAEAVIVEMRPTIEHRKIDVVMDIPAGLRALADVNGFREVLTNLLSNAVKYSPPGSTVRISARAESDAVVVAIADAGVGIPAAEQGKIFEKFFRASNVSTEEGTGLGLVVVKEFIEAMGGSVSFESIQGKGTTFFVRLKVNGKVA